MKIDIVYLAGNRPEFTAWSLAALAQNTDWSLVRSLIIYTDGAAMREGFIARRPIPFEVVEYDHGKYGGPVAIMMDYLQVRADRLSTATSRVLQKYRDQAPWAPTEVWAKIDNDVIVPPGWLSQCAAVMEANPQLDLLGIEPPLSRTPAPWLPPGAPLERVPENFDHLTKGGWPVFNPTFALAPSIGGIGLFRTRAWQGRPPMRPHSTYGGFTDWQLIEGRSRGTTPLVIGWIVPPLDLFLLDRLPMAPFSELSKRYIAEGQQRPWTMYSDEVTGELAGWWLSRNKEWLTV